MLLKRRFYSLFLLKHTVLKSPRLFQPHQFYKLNYSNINKNTLLDSKLTICPSDQNGFTKLKINQIANNTHPGKNFSDQGQQLLRLDMTVRKIVMKIKSLV